MKKILLSILNIGFIINIQAQFTTGNIAVVRVGDSIAPLANTGNFISIDQYTLSGSYVNSTALPRTGSNAVCLGGTTSSEGALTLAGNSSALVLFAYRTPAPYSSTLASSTSAAVNRAIVSINNSGVATIPTFTNTNMSSGNPRFAFTNGTNYWAGGGNTGIVFGSASSNLDTIVSSTTTNIRYLTNSGSQLYYSTASGGSGIWKVGNGAPSNSGNVSTIYIPTGTGSPYGFSMKFDSTVCYIADDRAPASGGGIQKWTRSGSTWTLAYTFGTGVGSTVGARGLAVNWNTTPPTIIATTAEGTINRIIRINDTSASVLPVTIATAVSNTIFRGVSFTPGTSTLPVKFTSFKANIINKQTVLNWSTSSETNNKGFEIQKSMDGKNFETIGFVKGAGNTNTITKYSYQDNYQSNTFYRLKQIDFDGKFEFTDIVVVKDMEIEIEIQLTPNPFTNNIEINSDVNILSAEIIDITGKARIAETINGMNATINTSDLSKGIYFVKISTGDKIITKKIIKN
jgi:hypothetical protein